MIISHAIQKSPVVIADRVAEEVQIQEMAQVYVRCLQSLLRAQSEALSSHFNQPDIIPLIRHLWLEFLPVTGILRLDHRQLMMTNKEIRDLRRKLAAAREGRESSDSSGEDRGGGEIQSMMTKWVGMRRRMGLDPQGQPRDQERATSSSQGRRRTRVESRRFSIGISDPPKPFRYVFWPAS